MTAHRRDAGFHVTIVMIVCMALVSVTAASEPEPSSAESAAPAAEAPSFLVGMAKADITPDLARFPVSLNGYGDRKKAQATGVLDPIFARALVVADPSGRKVAVVGMDLCYVTTELHDLVIEELIADGFTPDTVLISATHTHSAYAGYDQSLVARLIMGSYDEKLLDHTVDAVVLAVRTAVATARPAVMQYGSVDVEDLNRSRLDPNFQHGLGKSLSPSKDLRYPVNKRLTVLRFVDEQGGEIGALVHFSAHPTVLSPKNLSISADYPGVVYAKLEEKLGGDAVVLFLNGSLGDLAPIPDWEESVAVEIEQMKDFGNRVADAASGIWDKLERAPASDVRGSAIRIPFDSVTLRGLGGLTLPGFLSHAVSTGGALTFQALQVGPVTFLALPGEATTRTGAEIESLCGLSRRCVVVGPANGYAGYLVTPVEYETDGYESDACFLGRDALPTARDAMTRALEKID